MEKTSSKVNDSTMAIIDEDDSTGVGRTYECSYCKRGFTNAQALGGHMNIHRKDKAKAKQQQNNYYSSSLPKIPFKNNNNNNNININEELACYSNPNLSSQMSIYNYNPNPNNLYYQSYNSNNNSSNNNNNNNNYNYTYPFVNNTMSSTQTSCYYGNNNTRDFSSGRSRLFGVYDDHLGTDLSLRTNSSSIVNNHFHQGEENKNNEDKYGSIDLELRLGYDP